MSVLDDLVAEVRQLPPALQQQVLDHARSLSKDAETGPANGARGEADNPDQVEREATLGHS